MNYFKKNIRYLRETLKLKQDEMLAGTGIKGGTWSNYENGRTEPGIDTMITISKFFGVELSDLIETDLSLKGNLIQKTEDSKKHRKGNLIGNPIGNLNVLSTGTEEYLKSGKISRAGIKSGQIINIPITDIEVAAGIGGRLNSDHIEVLENIQLPARMVKNSATYLCVKIKGPSMAPTIQDSSYCIVRLLDRSEWNNMREEHVYIVSDKDGGSYFKRIKNRFKQGFITLMSDNPDKATFPNFNLDTDEINNIWYAEWVFTAKMPNIHDQFYSRLVRLEDQMEAILNSRPKM